MSAVDPAALRGLIAAWERIADDLEQVLLPKYDEAATYRVCATALRELLPADSEPCGEQASRCVCVKPTGHVEAGDRIHACDADDCGGSWEGTYAGRDFRAVNMPTGGAVRGLAADPLIDLMMTLPPLPRGGIRFPVSEPEE